MVDPVAIVTSLITGACGKAFNILASCLFRKKEIEDYIGEISFYDILESEMLIGNLPSVDIEALDTFLRSEPVRTVFAQLYRSSGKTPQEIENEFVELFCATQPILENSNRELAKKLYLYVKDACDENLHALTLKGELIGQEYRTEAMYKDIKNDVNQVIKKVDIISQRSNLSSNEFLSKDDIEYADEEFRDSKELIKRGQYEIAKRKISSTLGVLAKNAITEKKRLSEGYHLLGIIHNRPQYEGGDPDEAKRCLHLSIEYDPLNYKAKTTLASLYINGGRSADIEEAYKISKAVWEDTPEKYPQLIETLLWSMALVCSYEDAISFYESSTEAKRIVQEHAELLLVVSKLYMIVSNYEKALEYVDISLKIKSNIPDSYYIKGCIDIENALLHDSIPSDFELFPKLRDYSRIESSLESLQIALKLCGGKNRLWLEQNIKKEIYFCTVLLNKSNEQQFQKLRSNIDLSFLSEKDIQKLEFTDFFKELTEKNFSTAYNILITSSAWNSMSCQVKIKFALIFLKRGSPENAKQIFKKLEQDAKKNGDVTYWLNMSVVEALLGNKNGMIQALNRAKALSAKTEHGITVLRHKSALIQRYLDEGKEIDRYLTSLKEYAEKCPDEKLMIEIPALDADNKPTKEILDLFTRERESYEKFKKTFKSLCVPSYILKWYFGRPYAQIMNNLNDPDLYINYYAPVPSFISEMRRNLEDGDLFIFDYSSLLNLAKMGLLDELEHLHGVKCITSSLFDNIQHELIGYENQDLRILWDFLRKTDCLLIIEFEADKAKYKGISEHLDGWIIDSIELAARHENAIFMADDLNFIRLLKEYNIKGCITYFFLENFLSRNFIDEKIFGNAVGNLAERFYVFLPFDEDDLYYIAMGDDCKVTWRSFHLINQITLPGVNASRYSRNLSKFIEKLWASGALPEDKQKWLELILSRMVVAIRNSLVACDNCEVTLLKLDLVDIWKKAVSSSNEADLESMSAMCLDILDNELFEDIKKQMLSATETRMKELQTSLISK